MDIFSALAEPTRRDIIELLASRGQLSATDIYNEFPVSHPAISQHLKVLRDSNIVLMRKHAQQHLYQINPASFSEVESWLEKMRHLWDQQFSAVDDKKEE